MPWSAVLGSWAMPGADPGQLAVESYPMARLFGDRGEEKGEQGSGEACKLHRLQHQP
jgi:hypothetical protein